MDQALQQLLDKQAICDAIQRYARTLDWLDDEGQAQVREALFEALREGLPAGHVQHHPEMGHGDGVAVDGVVMDRLLTRRDVADDFEMERSDDPSRFLPFPARRPRSAVRRIRV